MCLGNGSATPQAIVDGVEDFQVTYGVRTVLMPAPPLAAPALRVPDIATYQQFTAAAVAFNTVQSVTVCLQLRGDFTSDSPRGAVGGIIGCNGLAVAGDGFIRRVYRQSFNLRSVVL